jgi:thioredoxin 1
MFTMIKTREQLGMKTPLIIVGVIAIFGLGFLIFSQQAKAPSPSQPQTTNENSTATIDNKTNDSRYVAYSKEEFDQAKDKRRVLFFYANWCPLCKPADTDFQANSTKIPEDVTLIRVNYNDTDTEQAEKDLAQKYGVTYQHTFVQIDSEENQVAIWNGGHTDELLANLK